MTLAVEDANTKLVDVVAFADVDIDDRMVTADSLAIAFQVRQLFNIYLQFPILFCQNLGLALRRLFLSLCCLLKL